MSVKQREPHLLPAECQGETALDGDIMFRIPMDPQPKVRYQGTDGHGCWERDNDQWGWWGREIDGYHRLHSTTHACPWGKEGDEVLLSGQKGKIHSIAVDRDQGKYVWCLWITPGRPI